MKVLYSKVIFSLFLWISACVTVSAPFFQPLTQTNSNTGVRISVEQIGYLGKVNGKWWGDRFFRVTLRVSNSTNQYQFVNFCSRALTENNFKYVLKHNPGLKELYYSKPEKFNKAGFLKKTAGIMLLTSYSGKPPGHAYRGKRVFPVVSFDGQQYLAAALLACEYGIPLRGALVDRSQNSTGWIEPGGSLALNLHFSLPPGEKPVAMKYDTVSIRD